MGGFMPQQGGMPGYGYASGQMQYSQLQGFPGSAYGGMQYGMQFPPPQYGPRYGYPPQGSFAAQQQQPPAPYAGGPAAYPKPAYDAYAPGGRNGGRRGKKAGPGGRGSGGHSAMGALPSEPFNGGSQQSNFGYMDPAWSTRGYDSSYAEKPAGAPQQPPQGTQYDYGMQQGFQPSYGSGGSYGQQPQFAAPSPYGGQGWAGQDKGAYGKYQ